MLTSNRTQILFFENGHYLSRLASAHFLYMGWNLPVLVSIIICTPDNTGSDRKSNQHFQDRSV